jgi:hypothetical protein
VARSQNEAVIEISATQRGLDGKDRNGNSGKGEPSTCQNSFIVNLDVMVIPQNAAVDEPKLPRRRYQEPRYQVSLFSFTSRGKSKIWILQTK